MAKETKACAEGRSMPRLGMAGTASCRLVEMNGCVTKWEPRWEVVGKLDGDEEGSVRLKLSGWGEELSVLLTSTRSGVRAVISEYGACCQLGMPEDAGKNVEVLEPKIGRRDAVTACYCIYGFSHETGWGMRGDEDT